MVTDEQVRGLILNELYQKYQEHPHNYITKSKIMKNTGISIESRIDGNIEYLKQKGLIEARWFMGGEFIARITAYGIDVIAHKDNLEKFHDTFLIEFGSINIEGDVNAPIIIGGNITITDSFNQLKSIAENKTDVSSEEKNEILNKIEELEDALSKETIHKPTIQKLKDFFSKYSDLFPMVITAISTALSQI
jgi:cell fate (sporulation/competence/biofilm development) regulator YmcA (YheA/YmcA/DUF963 family)